MASYKDIIDKKSKEWGSPDMMHLKESGKKIPFSSPMMNYATYGGIPRNAITEFHGAPGGGKSSTSQDICKQAVIVFQQEFEDEVQRLRESVAKGKKEQQGPLEDLIERGPQRCLYVDLEHSFDRKWAAKMGLKIDGLNDDIDIMQPPDIAAEQILQTIEEIITTGEVGLIVLDSIPSLVTQAELDKKYGERTVSALAGLMTTFMRKITPLLSRYGCTLLMINQIRDNMDNPYVVNTPGGNAIRFYASLRILFQLGCPVDFVGNELPQKAEDPAGYIINAKIVKQKSAPFDRKLGSYYLMAQSGIRPDFDYAQVAIKKYEIIRKSGGWFTMCNPETGEILCDESNKPIKVNGMVKVYEYLKNNQNYYLSICKYIDSEINANGADESIDPNSIDSMNLDKE